MSATGRGTTHRSRLAASEPVAAVLYSLAQTAPAAAGGRPEQIADFMID